MSGKTTIGFALTGSYCTFSKIIPMIERLVRDGYEIVPIFSDNASKTDSRFGKANDYIEIVEKITNNSAIIGISQAEPIGPKKLLDVLVVAPCTGNTIAKLAHGIADSTVTLAAKSHLRNNRPIVIAISTNDGLSGNAKNIGTLLSRKHFYLVPFGQDDCIEKPNSLISDFSQIPNTITLALNKEQIQPVLL